MGWLGNQKGEGKAGCVVWIVIAVVFGLTIAEVAPVKMATMKLEDYMEELAMTQPRKNSDFFKRAIHKKSEELGLVIERKQIKVKKYPERVIMDVEFVHTLDILGFNYDWNIHLELDRDIFLI